MKERLEIYECHKCKTKWKEKAGPQGHFKGRTIDGDIIVHACPSPICDSQYCTWITYEDFEEWYNEEYRKPTTEEVVDAEAH